MDSTGVVKLAALGRPFTGVVELAALGRPFALGMLYDMRNDSFITGMTLWDNDALSTHIQTREENYNEFEVITSDSLQSKSNALDVDPSLQLSILSGKVKVGGSGNYINERKTSKHQERVTLRFKETTHIEELSMYHLDSLQYQYVIGKGLATHVVTAILYGAQAFFVFDREVSEEENHQKINAEMKMMIKKLPKFSGQVKCGLKIDNEDQKKVNQFSCRFFGDVCLDKIPTTFQEAVDTYKSLPALLKDEGKAVPIKVFLLPLTALQPSAVRLVHQISVGLVKDVQRVLEDFIELEIRCNDALKTTTMQPFSQFGEMLKCFEGLCAEFKLEFEKTVAEKLPLIRGGGEEETGLAEILKKRNSSPFNSKDLNQWLDCQERKIQNIIFLSKRIKNTTFIQSDTELYKEILDVEAVYCFVFPPLRSEDPFLSALSDYLKRTKTEFPQDRDEDKHQRPALKDELEKVELFSDFAEANENDQNIKFLAMISTDEKNKGSAIHLYKDGQCDTEDFEPPSKPISVSSTSVDQTIVKLGVVDPKHGGNNIIGYSVEYQVCGEDEWKQLKAAKEEEIKVTGLKPNTKYMFRCRAMASVGVGPAYVGPAIKTM